MNDPKATQKGFGCLLIIIGLPVLIYALYQLTQQ